MRFSELPLAVQNALNEQLHKLRDTNNATTVLLYNIQKKRFFEAHRHVLSSKYGRLGGGSYWSIYYGEIGFKKRVNMGFEYYEIAYGRFGKSANGTVIPKTLDKKQEVIELVKNIGLFNI